MQYLATPLNKEQLPVLKILAVYYYCDSCKCAHSYDKPNEPTPHPAVLPDWDAKLDKSNFLFHAVMLDALGIPYVPFNCEIKL